MAADISAAIGGLRGQLRGQLPPAQGGQGGLVASGQPGVGAMPPAPHYNPNQNLHGLTVQNGQFGVQGQHGGFQQLGQHAMGRVNQVLNGAGGSPQPQVGQPPGSDNPVPGGPQPQAMQPGHSFMSVDYANASPPGAVDSMAIPPGAQRGMQGGMSSPDPRLRAQGIANRMGSLVRQGAGANPGGVAGVSGPSSQKNPNSMNAAQAAFGGAQSAWNASKPGAGAPPIIGTQMPGVGSLKPGNPNTGGVMTPPGQNPAQRLRAGLGRQGFGGK